VTIIIGYGKPPFSALVIIIFTLQPFVDLVFGAVSTTETVSYTFISIDIPNPSGNLGFTTLEDINNEGELAGGFTNSSGPGYLIDRKFSSADIQCPDTVNAQPNAQPQSINEHAEVTGFCGTGGKLHGFFRDRNGSYTLLDYPHGTLTEATGINDHSQIVGDYRDSGGKFHGFLWDAGLFLTIDVPFPEARVTGPNGINNVGQIVGFYDDLSGGRHGFLYDQGSFIPFDLPGSRLTAPTDINDRGQILGTYVDNSSLIHGFLLEEGRFTSFDLPLPNVMFTDVRGINSRGQIVGRYLVQNPNVNDIANPFLNTALSRRLKLSRDPNPSF